jgi:hypothetical protein
MIPAFSLRELPPSKSNVHILILNPALAISPGVSLESLFWIAEEQSVLTGITHGFSKY